MKSRSWQLAPCKYIFRSFVAVVCSFLIAPGDALLTAAPLQDQAAPETAAKLPADQLDALVAPIALYPDSLLSQALVASTYPLEIIQLQQWLAAHKDLKDKALTDAAMKQDWDPSIQAMAVLPDMVKQLAENIKWTTDLGNAFLAQQSEVMDAAQRMRAKAKDTGNLKSSEQQKVETKVIESKQVIVIQPANPEVVYVPSYNPTVVYGPPVYPYPPIVYPPVGYYAAGMALSFGVGMMVGAAWGGGGWGCGWGGNNDITINNNNSFVNNSNRNSNVNGGNRNQVNGGNRNNGNGSWKHNPQHRGGAPYGDRGTANKFGGNARGDNRQNAGAGNRGGSAGNRGASAGNMDRGGAGGGNRGGSPSAGNMDRGGAGGGDRGGNRGSSGGGGGDKVGNRSVPSSGSKGGGGAFGGGSGSSARASSSRGSSSMGGGGSRGGGGGGRSGGGGGRRR